MSHRGLKPSSAFRHASSSQFQPRPATGPGPPLPAPELLPPGGAGAGGARGALRPLARATGEVVALYKRCNPAGFRYMPALNPKRVLTRPSEGVLNGGADNANSDLVLYVNDTLQNHSTGHHYQIIDLLGQGTFGQVVKCRHAETNAFVAVKVVKNKLAYFNQGLVEVRILELLNQQYDPEDQAHIVRLQEYFVYKKHLCLVFELLSLNLYELIKQNQFRGLSTNLVRIFLSQILKALLILTRASVIHCDLKPENILLLNAKSPQIKLIDFGSACFEKQTVYSYIQSRFYRSPEVLLGHPYRAAIDMWSLGCIGAELFLGLPLFPGTSEYNQLARIVDMIGPPPDAVLERGKATAKFFHRRPAADGRGHSYTLKTEEEYARETGTPLHPSKKYFNYRTLDEIIAHFPLKSSLSPSQQEAERANRRSLCDFIRGLLQLDPDARWTPEQAARHPFITGLAAPLPWHPEPPGPAPALTPAPGPGPAASTPLTVAPALTPPAHTPAAGSAPPGTAAAVVGPAAPQLPATSAAPSQPAKPSAASAGHATAPLSAAGPVPAATAPAPAAPPASPGGKAPAALHTTPARGGAHRQSGGGSAIVAPRDHETEPRGGGRRGKQERLGTRHRSQSYSAESSSSGAQTWGLSPADPRPGLAPLPHPRQHHERGPAGSPLPPSSSPSSHPYNAASPGRRQPPANSVGSPPVPSVLPAHSPSRQSGGGAGHPSASASTTSPRRDDHPQQPAAGQQRHGRGPKRRSAGPLAPPGSADSAAPDDSGPGSPPQRSSQRGDAATAAPGPGAAADPLSISPPSKPPSVYTGRASASASASSSSATRAQAPSPGPPAAAPGGSGAGAAPGGLAGGSSRSSTSGQPRPQVRP